MHFIAPRGLVAIVPKALPAPLLLVYLSGVCEIALGVGLMVARTQRWAAWGLIALFIAVFPANLNMALRQMTFGSQAPLWLTWARLPLQGVLIAWAYWYTR